MPEIDSLHGKATSALTKLKKRGIVQSFKVERPKKDSGVEIVCINASGDEARQKFLDLDISCDDMRKTIEQAMNIRSSTL
ncbi:hypothetical protein HY967_04670 [Candidatus Jorgensenbacteria bacterium]|nr:hypothetical protein [Candidatus Jorgensenbacteria bacterium]